ncbi:MAG: arylsulfatase [Pirellulaceae bacterium]|nr:arylsulfatase [Pirellulaceae bacterium]
MRLYFLLGWVLLAQVAPAPAIAADRLAGSRPNVIVLLTDDQGYGDISAHGNPIVKTKHLDRLRDQSLRFTDFHVSPTCAPTRSALLTGRHEFKNGVTHTIAERERLTLSAITLAQVLQSAGYATGIFGKWHLGDEDNYLPSARGFSETFIHGAGGIGQSYPGSCGDAPGNTYVDPFIWHNDRFVQTSGFCTDVFFRQATTWIDQQRQNAQPFFAYISTNAPHAPYTARPEDAELYRSAAPSEPLAHFYGMIHNIDQNIGRLLDQLDQWNLAQQTLVIFINDNGTALGHTVFNAGMRGAKGSAWLGGTRSSCFWRWPGTIQPADCTALAAHIDFLPTLATLGGAEITEQVQRQVEGRSLVSLLRDPQAAWPDRTLFTHVGRWPKLADPSQGKYRMAAVRTTRWSLVSPDGATHPAWQLFDLQADYAQQHNVIEQHPDVALRLSGQFEEWWQACLPQLVNENSIGPRLNSFAERYWQQFGGQPTAQDLKRMDPTQPIR